MKSETQYGSPMGSEDDVDTLEREDEALMSMTSPKGKFTSKGLKSLSRAISILLPLMGQDPKLPPIEEGDVLPSWVMRILSMFNAASSDAIDEGKLDPSLLIAWDDVRDDSGLSWLGAKIETLARNPRFKEFLLEPAKEREPASVRKEEEPEEVDEDSLFMSRM
jgi:hypothetical protein